MEDTTEKNVWKMEIVSQLCFYWRVHFWDLWIRVWILELWEPSWLFSRPKGCLILLDIQPPPRRELVGGCLDSPCPNIDNLWNWAEWEYVCAWFCWSGFVSDKNAKMPGSHSISLTPSLTVKQLLAIWDMLLFVIILTSSTYRAISLDQMTYGWSMCLHRGPFCVCVWVPQHAYKVQNAVGMLSFSNWRLMQVFKFDVSCWAIFPDCNPCSWGLDNYHLMMFPSWT